MCHCGDLYRHWRGRSGGIYLSACSLLCHHMKNVSVFCCCSKYPAVCHSHYLLPALFWKYQEILEVLEVITTQMETDGCLENTVELNRKADTWWPSPPYMIKLVVLYPKDLGVVHCQAKGHPSTRFKNGKIKASKSKMGCPKVTHYGRPHVHKKWDSQH